MKLDFKNKKEINILDCTFRDGGYYNNWNFSPNLINKYLQTLSNSNIKYIEIGFRSLISDKNIGLTGYSNDSFLNSLKIPKNVKLGVMINSSEFIEKKSKDKSKIETFFTEKSKKKIKFVRLATHIDDLLKIRDGIRWLKKNKYFVVVNIMQISEIKFQNIKKYCKYLRKAGVDVIYLADSLGCLKPHDFKNIFKAFKRNWHGELGIHAHDNLNQALNNSIEALNSGANWIDGTIQGMGRGPGNTKTEKLIDKINTDKKYFVNFKKINKSLVNDFKVLKKKYKWGTNKHYYYSGLKKIHPTYIQEILSNKKNKKRNIPLLIKQLSKFDVKKYNPLNLYFLDNFYVSDTYEKFKPCNFLKSSSVLIVGPGNSIIKEKNKIKKFINKKDPDIFFTNTVQNNLNIKKFYRIACHPYRLITDSIFHKKNKDTLILPTTNLPKKISKEFNKSKKKILNFGLKISKQVIIKIGDNYCVLPQPLIIAYAISVALSGNIKKIYLAGFDGYRKDDPYNDPTQKILDMFKNKIKFKFLYSLTKTNYNI